MKIGLVSACYKPVINGVTRMVETLALAMVELGHEPTVFTLGPSSPEDQNDPFPVVRSPGVKLGQSGYFGALSYSKAVAERIKDMDILHAHHPAMCIELVNPIRGSIPLVFSNHTRYDLYAPLYLTLPSRLAQPLARRLTHVLWPARANLADHRVAPTPTIKKIMKKFGVAQPISVISNGIPPPPSIDPIPREQFGWTDEQVVLISVGRLSAEKNVTELLNQFARAFQINQTLRLLLVGDGPARPQIEQQIGRLGLHEAVQLAGERLFGDVPAFLRTANLLVTASKTEVDPLNAIEAMMMGLPVIAYRSDWSGDCLPEEGSWIADEIDDLATAILNAAEDKKGRQRRGQAAQEFARTKTIAAVAKQTLALYSTLLVHK